MQEQHIRAGGPVDPDVSRAPAPFHANISTRGPTVLCLNPWPSPDLVALGLDGYPRKIPGPVGKWYVTSPPGTSPWREAIDGITHTARSFSGLERRLEVFATTAPSIAAVLGLYLSRLPVEARFWLPAGLDWHRAGAALDHGRTDVVEATTPTTLQDGRPIALLVEFGAPIMKAAVPLDLAGETQHITLSSKPETLLDPRTAQQAAFDLHDCLTHLARHTPFSAVHLFYTGPLAILMMAASAFRDLRSVVSYERFGRTRRWRPAVHLQSGRAHMVPA